MENIDLVKKHVVDDIELEGPDNIIQIEFPEHPKSNMEETVLNNLQENTKFFHRNISSIKETMNHNVIDSYKNNNKNLDKILISIDTSSKTTKKPLMNYSRLKLKRIKILPSQKREEEYINKLDSDSKRQSQIQIFIDAQTQTTEFSDDDDEENLNVFCCTFHADTREVETYCNISSLHPRKNPKYDVNETSDVFIAKDSNNTLRPNGTTVESSLDSRPSVTEKIHEDRMRRKVIYNDPPVPLADARVNIEEEIENQECERAAKGYRLRTKRLFQKFSDMQYTLIQNVKKKKKNFGVMKCMHCPEEFATFCRLEKHSKQVHGSCKFSFQCDICHTTFTRPHNLRRHLETKHGEGQRKYLCEHCGRGFNRQDILTSHTHLVHSKINFNHRKSSSKMKRLHQCTFCNKYFSRAQNFENHQKGNLSCSKCSETFSCKTGLRNHLYKHHSVACCLCGKVCANRQQLYFHTLAHSPKFKCKYCSKGFIWESQFVVHLATHTGYKPLSCEICGKCFAHRNAVNKHKWQEHTEANKKFPCKVCGKSFVYKAKLESHLRSHTGEKPFACHLCPSSFSQNCNLSAHIKSVHGIYLQSMKKGNQKITAATLLKPIKVVKKFPPPNSIEPAPLNQHLALPTHPHSIQSISVGTLRPSQMVKSIPKEQMTSVSTQLYSGEVISEPFSNGETVYQILYAYPSQ